MHLSSEVVFDLLEGRAQLLQAAALTAHIHMCSDCNQQLNEWRKVHALLGRTHLAHAPDNVLRNAEAIFTPPRASAAAAIRQIVASLVFDSFTQPAFAGARGATDDRQVVLRAEEFDVHIKIFGDNGQRQLIGQIFARDENTFPTSTRLQLLQNGERVGMTQVDQFGGFQFEEVPQGSLSLQIDMPNLTVVGALNSMEMA